MHPRMAILRRLLRPRRQQQSLAAATQAVDTGVRTFASSKHAKPVELRSDTFTKPCEGMRKAMYAADCGDSMYGEDKTVQRLEEAVAGLLGKEAGLFGASAIRDDDHHFARTRLVAVETTHNKADGSPLPRRFMEEVAGVCREHKLVFHIDGARLMNASVALKASAADICRDADSVSLCLSKGLGAPVGSVLVGTQEVIKEAKRQRKVVGGGWRQAGVVAAAALYALEHNVPKLELDHANARALAQGLSAVPGIVCDPSVVHTNIVYFRVLGMPSAEVVRRLKEDYNVWLGLGPYKGDRLRAVTNLMVTREDIARVVDAMANIVGRANRERVDATLASFREPSVAAV